MPLEQRYLSALRQFVKEAHRLDPGWHHEGKHSSGWSAGSWSEEVELWIKYSPFSKPIPLPPNLASIPFPDPMTEIHSFEEIFSNLHRYFNRSELLRIDKAKMSSPGGFSFVGLAEIIEQIRELIKDIWYKNKKERIVGNLEILEKYLSIHKNHIEQCEQHLPPIPDAKYLIDVVESHLSILKELEAKGLLKSIPENMDGRLE